MKRLWKYIKPHVWFIGLTVFIKLSAALFELLIPYFMEIILDTVVPSGIKSQIIIYGCLMALAAGLCLAGNIIANRMSAVSSGKITLKLRHDLFGRTGTLSAKQLDGLTVSSAESRLTSDTYNFNQFLARMQRLGIRAPILLAGGLVMMFMMDAVLALVLTALLPIICVIVYFVTKKSIPLYTREQSVLDDAVRVLQENITGARVIKALGTTEREEKRFSAVNDELTNVEQKAGVITSLTNPSTSLVLNIGLTLVVLIGAYRVNAGLSKSGIIIAFLQYFVMILNAMLGITRIFVQWSKGEASADRIADVLAIPDDLIVSETDDKTAAENNGEEIPHVEFKNVTFSYTGNGNHLENISFKLSRGESLGIIGATGCGKSTIINLLLRMYDADSGEILINGRNVKSLDPKELKSSIGVVFQNDFAMEGTIRENISFFRDLREEDIQKAAENAQATEFINKKENGLDSAVVVRGNNLSGGQKQRLFLARALASSPEILILDDATSALDYKTDASFRKAIAKNYPGATSIRIAQRVSSVSSCTKIIFMDDGKAVGFGTHEELMASCPEYAKIAESQMGEGRLD